MDEWVVSGEGDVGPLPQKIMEFEKEIRYRNRSFTWEGLK